LLQHPNLNKTAKALYHQYMNTTDALKKSTLILLLILQQHFCNAQFLKKLEQKTKEELEYRTRRKAGQKIDQGLDSILAAPKKILNKKKAENNVNTNTEQPLPNMDGGGNNSKGNIKKTVAASSSPADNVEPKDGYITMSLSADAIFTGGSITISGMSARAKNFTQVEITVTGPVLDEVKSVELTKDGQFTAVWYAPEKPGTYNVNVKSSDKKAQQFAKVEVYALPQLANWCDENIELTNKAFDKLKEAVDKAGANISPKNKTELEEKLAGVKEKKDDMLKLFRDLNTAGKQTAELARSAKSFPKNLANNLSDLNNTLGENARQMKEVEQMAEHAPQDNTICEYLVMVNEAAAAFSTFTNFKVLSITKIIGDIILDKVVPKAVSTVNHSAGGIEAPNDFPLTETSKIYAISKFDATSLSGKIGKAGIGGDIIQFATDVLLKIYCGVFTGSFTHDYNITYRTREMETWWSYGFTVKGAVSLRYPKKNTSHAVIKMKGNLEGNATAFRFFQNIEKEDSYQEGTKGKIQVFPIHTYTPLSVPFVTAERDILGFGAIARGLATPAYINIPIDAEYDVDAGKIKVFINPALIDFSSVVANHFVFLLIGGDLLPYVKHITFPIAKARSTIASVVTKNNEFTVEKGENGKLNFSGTGNKHIGDMGSAREHQINFSITAKNY
jgi:hypothetical protein